MNTPIIIAIKGNQAMICEGVRLGDSYTVKPGGIIYREPAPEPDPMRLLNVCRSWAKSNGIHIEAEIKI